MPSWSSEYIALKVGNTVESQMQTQDEKKVVKGLSPSECTPHSEKSSSGAPRPSRAHTLQHGLRGGSHRGTGKQQTGGRGKEVSSILQATGKHSHLEKGSHCDTDNLAFRSLSSIVFGCLRPGNREC